MRIDIFPRIFLCAVGFKTKWPHIKRMDCNTQKILCNTLHAYSITTVIRDSRVVNIRIVKKIDACTLYFTAIICRKPTLKKHAHKAVRQMYSVNIFTDMIDIQQPWHPIYLLKRFVFFYDVSYRWAWNF